VPWAVRRRSDGKWLKRTSSGRHLVDDLDKASTWPQKSNAKASARAAMSVLSTAASGVWQPVEVEFIETCIAETGVVEVCRVVQDPSKSYSKIIVETISKPQRQGFRMPDSPQGAFDDVE
jgi:hypothetical protein